MKFLRAFYDFMKVRKKYWLLPIVLFIGLLFTLVFFAQTAKEAPFVYTTF